MGKCQSLLITENSPGNGTDGGAYARAPSKAFPMYAYASPFVSAGAATDAQSIKSNPRAIGKTDCFAR